MDVSVDVKGLDEAIARLQGVEQRASLRVIRGAIRFGMKPAIAKAESLIPVDDSPEADDYSLRDHVGLRAERKKNRAGNATSMRFGAHRETAEPNTNGGYAVKGGLTKRRNAPNYASLIHDETPFLMRAVEQTQDEVVKRFGERFMKAVAKL